MTGLRGRAVVQELWPDVEHGCSRYHPERQTREAVRAAFDELQDRLAELGVRDATVLVAEAEIRALQRVGQRAWLDDVKRVEGQLLCLWCRSHDFYVRLSERLYREGCRLPVVLQYLGLDEHEPEEHEHAG